MLRQLATSLIPITICVAMQAGALVYLFRALSRIEDKVDAEGDLYSFRVFMRVAVVIIVQHCLQGLVWAVTYLALGCFPNIETSLYYSLSTYTALGYGDVMLPTEWRDLGPMEAVNGILMFGWSAGFIFAVVVRIFTGKRVLGPLE